MTNINPFKEKIPQDTLIRIPEYLRIINAGIVAGETHLSSGDIADRLGVTSAVIRKDFTSIGSTGKPRTGFNLQELKQKLEHTLGYDDIRYLVLVGDNSFTNALLDIEKLREYGLIISGIHLKSGVDQVTNLFGNESKDIAIATKEDLKIFCASNTLDIAVLDTNLKDAQEYVDLLTSSGIKAIWNYINTPLDVPDDVIVQSTLLEETLGMLWYKMKTAKM